jgi:GNAT superfamily N-acetyltransferase
MLAVADRNFVTAWRRQTGFMPAPGHHEAAGAVMLSSGLPVPLFNPAFVLTPPPDVHAVVAAAVEHYGELGTPFIIYFRDETAPGLADACLAAGLVEHYQPPLMVMDPIVDPPAPPPGAEIVPVDATNVAACGAVLGAGFGMPDAIVHAAFPASVVEMEGLAAVLALVDGKPAATAACIVSDDIVGIYNVATVPAHRGRGLGAAVTWAAIAAGARSGATVSVLQASGEGAPVYERMGFLTRDRYRQLEGGA